MTSCHVPHYIAGVARGQLLVVKTLLRSEMDGVVTAITDLPPELLESIFEYLTVEELTV